MGTMSDAANGRAELVECVDNEGYEVDLRIGGVYQLLPDPVGACRGFLRVIDETGEDFMFPNRCFLRLDPAHAT
jgi:hypothetical protein